MKITFLGATKTVTGSKYLIEFQDKRILIDCGLFQGFKELRLRNWDQLPVNPKTIDAVILTHAHIDHSGYIPLLVKNGFEGKIYCSEATYELCSILLPDSGFLQENDASRANRYGYSKHNPALPLYTEDEARKSLDQFETIDFGQAFYLNDDMFFTLSRSGHILGSSFIVLTCGGKKITFSGDLGRSYDPIMKPPAELQTTDYLLIESTYGDRLHEKADPEKVLAKIIKRTVAKGGSVIIPSFAVGRTQMILYYLYMLKQKGAIPQVPIYLDSPMAINATKMLCRFNNEHKLSNKLCSDFCSVASYVNSIEESKELDQYSSMPKIIISASGMVTGGRILHHLKSFMGDRKNTIVFTGFQAGGTRGDRMLRGEKHIKIHGEMHALRARVEYVHNLSAHADYQEILDWLSNFRQPPKKTFITHGELEAAKSLKEKIQDNLGWKVTIPEYLHKESL